MVKQNGARQQSQQAIGGNEWHAFFLQIQERVAAPDGLMELRGDETGTLFHPVGIQLPCAKEVRYIVCVDSEEVDQYHWSFAALQLLGDGDDRVKDGLLEFQPNPHHRRAQLVVLTEAGKQAFDSAMKLQAPWINELSLGLDVDAIQTTHQVLNQLRNKLEEDQSDSPAERPLDVTKP
ncbi:MarR family winged helix-turn-helix transcriptional regulator [Pseudomonas neuropathica]|uniref:MarR family winged helix-turn-helix transcriptional regulator n=1 Tax=Pseudomonas neuropathica TaxID=2730425 RepID=UPI001E3ADA79|nr:MarR family winged helix-turn-helix transcriptional regulator [Pseudomonas neuropathica]